MMIEHIFSKEWRHLIATNLSSSTQKDIILNAIKLVSAKVMQSKDIALL